MLDKKSKIYVSGHNGMVGRAVLELLKNKGYTNLIFKNSRELDLRSQDKVEKFIKQEAPDYVFLFAAKVGGIKENMTHFAQFLYDNIMIESNLIHSCYKYKVKKLLYLGSSCVYPRQCPQPMKEEYLLTGKVEPTNEGYALAKITGLKLCEYYNKEYETNFIALTPPNLYGQNDNFDLNKSHVIPGLIHKFVDAEMNNFPFVEVWGTGKARREFLYVDDLADACLYFMNNFQASGLPPFVNVGCGYDVTIKELVKLIKAEVGYKGDIKWNSDMPDGMPQKLVDSGLSKEFGWKPAISLEEGLKKTIKWYKENIIEKREN